MKNIINQGHKEIESVLSSFKPNESVSLSLSEKENILKSVFERSENVIVKRPAKSPFYNYKTYFVQYLRYSIPVLLLAIIGTQAAEIFTDKTKIALSDIGQIKSNIEDRKRDNAIKSNLSKNKQDILEIKSLASSNQPVKTQILADQVSSRSREIRNQVAALMSEDKVTEAKKVALDLETALKADELYKVSTSVEQEVFEAIDLRVDIEKKESNTISSSTESDIQKRIDLAKEEFLKLNRDATVDATTTESVVDMLGTAEKSIETADVYLKDKDFGNAIISLQLYDRTVAELKTILLP